MRTRVEFGEPPLCIRGFRGLGFRGALGFRLGAWRLGQQGFKPSAGPSSLGKSSVVASPWLTNSDDTAVEAYFD